jgi:TPR repeat protein
MTPSHTIDLDKLNKSASKLISSAVFSLGFEYLKGERVEKDDSKAFSLFNKATVLKYYPSFFAMGIMNGFGLGNAKDEEKAVGFFKTALENGIVEAEKYLIGDRLNLPESEDYMATLLKYNEEAVRLLLDLESSKRFKLLGNSENDPLKKWNIDYFKKMKNSLALLSYREKKEEKKKNNKGFAHRPIPVKPHNKYYWDTESSELPDWASDPIKKQEMLKKAAEGDALAQNEVGLMYLNSNPPRYDKAINWLLFAAESGISRSMLNLSQAYIRRNKPGDKEQYLMWLKKAADISERGLYTLVTHYYMENDFKNALDILNREALKGSAEAMVALGDFHLYYPDDEEGSPYKDEDAGLAWLSKASDLNSGEGAYLMGLACLMDDFFILDEKEAFRHITIASQAGWLDAKPFLASFYLAGKVTPKDPEKALALFEEAGKEGHSQSLNILGEIYINSPFVKQNIPLAMEYFKKAADLGDQDAFRNLACYYLLMKERANLELCAKYGVKAARMGDEESLLFLRKAFKEYNFIPKDNQLAAQYLYYISSLGDPQATYLFAERLYTGQGVPKNVVDAILLLKKNAKRFPAAYFLLGLIHESGKDIPKNNAKAIMFYNKAAVNGVIDAQFRLGFIFDTTRKSKRYKKLAFKLYKTAAKGGHHGAMLLVALKYLRGLGVKKNVHKAAFWYKKSARLGDKFAQFTLSEMYAEGIGVPRDLNKSLKWLKRSAKKNFPTALLSLSKRHFYGDGAEKNIRLAEELCAKAADSGEPEAIEFLKIIRACKP